MPSKSSLNPLILATKIAQQEYVTPGEMMWLLEEARKLFDAEPNLLRLQAPIRIVGDIHGQYFDMMKMLAKFGGPCMPSDTGACRKVLPVYVCVALCDNRPPNSPVSAHRTEDGTKTVAFPNTHLHCCSRQLYICKGFTLK